MAGTINKVIIIGFLGADPEIAYMPSGDAAGNIRVATTRRWKDKSGETREETEWHRCVFYGRLAEVVGEYLKKGSLVFVEGHLRTRKWTDRDGTDRYSTEIVGERMTMLDRKDGGEDDRPARRPGNGRPAVTESKQPAKKPVGKFDDMEDDIPF